MKLEWTEKPQVLISYIIIFQNWTDKCQLRNWALDRNN